MDTLFSRIGRIPRAQMLYELNSIDFAARTINEKLQILRTLIVYNAAQDALDKVHQIQKITCTPQQQGEVQAAVLRLTLEYPELCENVEALSLQKTSVRWVESFIRSGADIAYPTEILDISVTIAKEKPLVVDVHTQCPACRQEFTGSIGGDVLPLGDVISSHWFCPHCLARRELNTTLARQKVLHFFKNFVEKFPKNADGTLCNTSDAVLVLLCAKAFRPLGLIRFGNIYSCRIGHLMANTATYLLERKMGLGEASLDYLGVDPSLEYGAVANTYLLELWDRVLKFNPIGSQMVRVAETLPDMRDSEHLVSLSHLGSAQSALEENPVQLPFTLAEHEQAIESLERMGIPRDAKRALFIVREPAYMQKNFIGISDAHNTIKNLDINSCQLAVEYLAKQDYYCLRMGAAINKPLTYASDKIIDYAQYHRSDFMDIWLFANSDLVLSGATGPDVIPVYVNRNILFFNYISIGQALFYTSKTTNLFRYPYSTRDKRYLSLQELLSSPTCLMIHTDDFANSGIELHLNSPLQIRESIEEKIRWMQGEVVNGEDKLLQNAFWKLAYKYMPIWNEHFHEEFHGPKLFGTVSSVFLRHYRDELLAL